MTHQPPPDVIDRYLAGEATPREIQVIDAHRKADPDWGAKIDALRSELAGSRESHWHVDAAWARLQPTLANATARPPVLNGATPRRPTPYVRTVSWMAAAVVVAVAAGLIWLRAQHRAPLEVATAEHEVATPNGSRHTFTLDDGTRVTLNAGSRLRWRNDFGASVRDVWLDGEAYFSVTHDASRPFRVRARGAIARDLGTRFAMRAYAELPAVEVVVAEGSVSLRHDRAESPDSAVLTAGQLGRIDSVGAPTVETNVRVDRWTAWTAGSLVLEGVTLGDAIPQIERWYDATITVADPALARKRVTARFHDETLPQTLDALALALGARWERTGRSITLTMARP